MWSCRIVITCGELEVRADGKETVLVYDPCVASPSHEPRKVESSQIEKPNAAPPQTSATKPASPHMSEYDPTPLIRRHSTYRSQNLWS